MSVCRQCERDIIFAVTAGGKRMPLDPAPSPDGNVAVYRDHLGRLNARVLVRGVEPEPYEKRAMPHFASCPGRAPERPVSRPDGVAVLAVARDRRRRRSRA